MNPFSYQGPVEPHALIDRRLELDVLQRAAADRVAIRLAAPRRFGKTSLLDAHIASMRAVGHRAVRVDLSKVANVGDVAARVAESFSALPTDPRRSVRRWAARLGVTAKLAGVQLSIAPSAARPGADEARAALLELLDVPLGLHEADGGVTIVCLDEFQDLLVADDALDGLFRSVIQHHAAAAAYVFAGSQPSLMRALFSERERPFYGQARPLELPPLDGVIMANSLHFHRNKDAILQRVYGYLKPGGQFLLVEYNVDRGNPWVPYPFSYGTWEAMAQRNGFAEPRLLATHPSRFLEEIYSAACHR